MAIARKIAYNVFFNATAKILSTVLSLVGIGFITRYLGTEGFGDYATVLAFFSLFSSVADLGLYSITTREISRIGADEKKILSNVVTLRIVSAVAVFLFSLLVIKFLPYPQAVKNGILLVSAAFIFSSGYMVLNGIFQKNLAMDRVATVEFLGKILQVGFIILAVRNEWGFTAIVASLLIFMVFNFVVVYILSRRYVKFKFEMDFSYWKKFLKESWPMGMSVFITFLYFKMDTILLSVLKSSADVGIYNAAYKVIENITFFPAMIIGLILPLMARYIFSDKKKFEEISNKIFKVFVLLVVPLVIGTVFLADGVISLIGGSDFQAAGNALRILVFALMFMFFGHFFNSILLSGNLQKKLMLALAGCAAFNIIANLILIPRYSFVGAAATSVFTEMLVVGITFYLVVKHLNYKPRLDNGSKILFSGLVMAGFLYFLPNLNFFVLAIGSAAVYFLFLWLTRIITKQELVSVFARSNEQ